MSDIQNDLLINSALILYVSIILVHMERRGTYGATVAIDTPLDTRSPLTAFIVALVWTFGRC